MLQKLKLKAESFDHWVNKVKEALDPTVPKTMDLNELKALLNEADGKKFPKSDLLQTLTNAVEDAEKCASVIHQLDLNKIRTRTRNSSDAKYKLTVEELVLFCEEIDSLACVLEEGKSVKELLAQTKQFEAESKRLLEMPLNECSIPDLEKCLDQGNSLCIELPNLKLLNNRLRQAVWFKEVKSLRKKGEMFELQDLKNLILSGVQLHSDPVVDKEMAELQVLLRESNEFEDKVQKLFSECTVNVLVEAEQLLLEADEIEVFLPAEAELSDAINRAKEWLKQLEEINSAEYYPYYSTMEELIRKGNYISLKLEEVGRLESYLQAASAWKEKTSRTFLRKSTTLNLIDALSPRAFVTVNGKRKRNYEEDSILSMFDNNMDPAAVVALFKNAEDREMEMIRNMRQANLNKSMDANDCHSFCVCQRGIFGLMMQCELCKDWFHSICVQLPKIATTRNTFLSVTANAICMGFKDCKFLCPNCYRTRRPRLETILSLLMSLQKLYIRVPEGEALQCLTERAMNWQDRARQFLQSPELEDAAAQLAVLMQKYNQSVTKEKEAPNAIKVEDDAEASPLDDSGINGSLMSDSSDKSSPTSTEDCMGEHAYSMHVTPKINDKDCFIHISPQVKQQLEDLLMEGDLLEVSLDETTHLWKLLQASRNPDQDVLIDFDVSCIVELVDIPYDLDLILYDE